MMIPSRSMLTGFLLFSGTFASVSTAAIKTIPIRGARFATAADIDSSRSALGLSASLRDADPTLHSTETDAVLARSDAHFVAGRKAYFEGDLISARREFDAAIDELLNAPDSLPDRRRVERRLDEVSDLIYRFDLEKLGAGRTEEAVAYDKAPIDEISHMTFPVDAAIASRLKAELNQTASGIPLELTDQVLSFVHFFSSDRGRNILLAGFQRSGRYRELIQRIFTEEGVPQELIYLAQAESGFLPRAVSNKNAVGMWQFIAGTGSLYQLNRTAVYDERLDPEKATRAAARYLRDLYARYNDWYLAMAAYNCGAGAVDRAVERTGYADYWELLKRHALPRETASYVPIIVAMTIIAKHPHDYGLDEIQLDAPVEYETIQVTAPTNLDLIADATLQPVSVVRDLNPALLRPVAPVGYDVHVPAGTRDTAIAAIESVPAANRQAWRLHHVLAGDTLASIAKSYHVSPGQIASVNPVSDSLEQGDVLLIPAVYHEPPTPRHSRLMRTHTGTVAMKSSARRGTRIAASRHLSVQVLHRRAALRTASVQR